MGRIFLTGDTHRDLDIEKLTKFASRTDLTKEDYLIVLGDFGVIWDGYTEMRAEEFSLEDVVIHTSDWEMIARYNAFPWTTLFIDGNHENHPAIAKYQVEEWNGGKIHRISSSIFHLMRGQVYEIHGVKLFTMGGATSIDRELRREGVSWWPEEVISRDEMSEGADNLALNGFTVDYILTHDCGEHTARFFLKGQTQTDPVRRMLSHLDNTLRVDYKQWYFGHHHIDTQIDDKHTAVYNSIIEL